MRKDWQPMQVKVVGEVQEVVQGHRGKYSDIDVGMLPFTQTEPE